MEGALVSLAIKAGHDIAAARARFVRLEELPFDARHRYMATLNRRSGRPPVAYVKGAPEQVVAMCSHVADIDGSRPIDPQYWHSRIEELAADGQRVIALLAAPCRRTAGTSRSATSSPG